LSLTTSLRKSNFAKVSSNRSLIRPYTIIGSSGLYTIGRPLVE